jgi:alkenylglycerophosphocholine hydrolase
MTSNAWILATVAAIAMVVDWWAVHNRRQPVENVAKPMVMIGLIGIALAADFEPASTRPWIIVALVLGLAGDVCLLPQVDKFIAGLGAFLLGHSAYLVAFSIVSSPSWLLLIGLVGAAALIAAFGVDIISAVRGSAMVWPVTAYIAVTVTIIMVGAATGRWLVAMGALVFALSDGLLGSDRFVRPAPERRVLVHVLYHTGQAAILVGSIAA